MSALGWLWYWHVKRRARNVPYFVARCMPRWLVYHCAIRLIAEATTGRYAATIVPDLSAMDALDRWNQADALEAKP